MVKKVFKINAIDLRSSHQLPDLGLSVHKLYPRLTGHSLGGALAQWVAIQSHRHPQTVIFNSPGIRSILHGHSPHENLHSIHNLTNRALSGVNWS